MKQAPLINPFTFALFLCLCTFSVLAQPRYNVTRLPTNAQIKYLYPTSINNSGQVVGYWYGPQNYNGPGFTFIYSNGNLTDLGPLIGGTSNYGYDINDSGQIVGTAYNGSQVSSFIFSVAEGRKVLAPELPPGTISVPYGINNRGQVVGYIKDFPALCSRGQCPAVFLPNDTYIVIDAANSVEGCAYDINDVATADGIGQVVGTICTSPASLGCLNGFGTSFVYENGILNLGLSSTYCPHGGTTERSKAVNNLGQMTGICDQCTTICPVYGFIYNIDNSSASYLGNYFTPIDINDSGWVVGGFTGSTSPPNHPFLSINGTVYNLWQLTDDPGYYSQYAQFYPIAINNQGLIIASANVFGSYLLTPW